MTTAYNDHFAAQFQANSRKWRYLDPHNPLSEAVVATALESVDGTLAADVIALLVRDANRLRVLYEATRNANERILKIGSPAA